LNVILSFIPRDSLELVDKSTWSLFHTSPDLEQYRQSMVAVKGEHSDNFYKQLRFFSLMQALQFVLDSNVQGDVAECGVWRGHSAHMIASRLSTQGQGKVLHLFDSFEGLSIRTELDSARSSMNEEQKRKEREYFAVDLEVVKRNLSKFSCVRFHKGWIPERFIEVQGAKFCFVHLDVDLFQPMIDSLNFFAPKISDGGVIVVDDYGHADFTGAKEAVDRFLRTSGEFFKYEVPLGGAILYRSRKVDRAS